MEKKGKILIVDDNEDVLLSLNMLLKPYVEGIRVINTPERIIGMMDSFMPDVIMLDPPRKGCDEATLSAVVRMAPRRVVYVSCDSATLARDLKMLCEKGYEVEKVRCCDMFGWTTHVETVVLLQRKNM